MNSSTVKSLLNRTQTLIHHQRELEKVRGETFNVFSVLQMERLENTTHSRFLAELLNPDGSHLKGKLFLELFLQQIDNKSLDVNSATVSLEYYIGPRNDELKIGGRIDIFIQDEHGNMLLIENKIDAGDQQAQIERYVNYNTQANTVYYLNLFGDPPSPESKGQLESEKDFHIISYRDEIIDWLNTCYKECTGTPILRESILQYIILLKKLTSSMDHKSEKELIDLIFDNHEAAEYIAKNLNEAKNQLCEELRQDVIKELRQRLKNEHEVSKGANTDKRYAQIWIKIKGDNLRSIYFGVESFSVNSVRRSLFVGTFIYEDQSNKYLSLKEVEVEKNGYWADVNEISDFESYPVQMFDMNFLKRIHQNPKFRNGLVMHISNQVVNYIEEKTPLLKRYLIKEDENK